MIYECEQCNGTGWVNGQRCPCRDEDDTAAERRRRMGLVGKVAELELEVDRKPGFLSRQRLLSKHLGDE